MLLGVKQKTAVIDNNLDPEWNEVSSGLLLGDVSIVLINVLAGKYGLIHRIGLCPLMDLLYGTGFLAIFVLVV